MLFVVDVAATSPLFLIFLKFSFAFHLLVKFPRCLNIRERERQRCYSRSRRQYNTGYNVHVRSFDEYIRMYTALDIVPLRLTVERLATGAVPV